MDPFFFFLISNISNICFCNLDISISCAFIFHGQLDYAAYWFHTGTVKQLHYMFFLSFISNLLVSAYWWPNCNKRIFAIYQPGRFIGPSLSKCVHSYKHRESLFFSSSHLGPEQRIHGFSAVEYPVWLVFQLSHKDLFSAHARKHAVITAVCTCLHTNCCVLLLTS